MAASEYVTLRGGPAVPLPPVLLLLDLEARGFTLVRDGDALIVQPAKQLAPADRDAIRQWKAHLLALIEYQPPRVA